MIRCLLAVVLNFGLSVASAQAPPDSVEIGGWALPEGAVIRSVTRMSYDATATTAAEKVPYLLTSRDSVVTRVEQVADGRIQRVVQRLEILRPTLVLGGEREPSESDPLLGRDVVMTRTADGWTKTPRGWTPSADDQDAFDQVTTPNDDVYPLRMAVGQTVELSQAAIARIYVGATDETHRFTIRLDSTGTRDGAPVAYLTEILDVTTADDATMRRQMRARIVRHLGWRIDIDTHQTGTISTQFTSFDIDGFADYKTTQTVDLPEAER